MKLLKSGLAIDFMSKRKLAAVVSGLALLVSVGSLIINGLNFGIDFTGGTLIEVGYSKPVDLENVRGALADGDFGRTQTQHFGTSRDVLSVSRQKRAGKAPN